jgi:hypothetical protein
MRYMAGCRCIPCRAANSRYSCWRDAENKAGRRSGIVDAKPARQHIFKLGERGIGYKSVARDARVGKSIVFEIRSGKRQRIRESTERRILAVDDSAARAGTVIAAAPTWRKIEHLLREGFTKRSLAQRLGYRNGSIQFDRDTITARNARKVGALYRTLMVGGLMLG